MNNIFAIYSRKSKFTGKGESINNQIEKCQNHLSYKYKNKKINIKIYADEGFTGYNTNRPEFQKLLTDIKMNKVKVVIVYKLDRISRNVTDFCNLKDLFEKYNVDFISVTENFDTSTPLGNAMLMISSVFAQLERDTIAERVKDNMYALAKTGRWLGGNTPLGFTSEKIETMDINGKKRNLYRLKQIPEERKIIELLWNKLNELKGIHKLESYLIQNNIKTRNGNYFTRFSLMDIFKNPVYAIADKDIIAFFKNMKAKIYYEEKQLDNVHGLIAYNKREEKKGKADIKNDVSKWIIAPGKHEGIISSRQFIQAWNLLDQNKNKRFRSPKQNESILSGLIKCKYCNSYMRPRLRTTYEQSGKRKFSYLCTLKDKSRKKLCQCKNIDGIKADKLVIKEINNLNILSSIFSNKLQEITKNIANEKSKKQNIVQNLKVTYTNNKIKIEKLINKLIDVDKDILNDITNQIKKLKNKNNILLKEIKEIETNNTKKINKEKISIIAHQLINNYMKYFESLNLIDKRNLIRLLISSVSSDGKNIYITFLDDSLPHTKP